MSVPYSGMSMRILNLLAGWHAASPTLQTMFGVAGAGDPVAAARALLVEIDAESDPAGSHGVFGQPIPRYQRTPGGAWQAVTQFPLFFEVQPTEGDSVTEGQRRVWNALDGIAVDVARAISAAGFRQIEGIDPMAPMLQDESDPFAGWYVGGLIYTIRGQLT